MNRGGIDVEVLARAIARSVADALGELEHEVAPARPAGFTTRTLAADLGITPRAVRAAIERGDLVAVKRAGRYFIAPDAVDAFLAPAHGKRRRGRPGRGEGTLGRYMRQAQAPDPGAR